MIIKNNIIEKYTISYLVAYVLFLIIVICMCSSCSRLNIVKTIVKTDTIREITVVTPKTIIIPGDKLIDTIFNPCDSTSIIESYKRHKNASVMVSSFKTSNGKKNFIITSTCDEYKKTIDSFKIVTSLKEKASTSNTEVRTITKKYIPKFMWYVTGIALLIILISLSKFFNFGIKI